MAIIRAYDQAITGLHDGTFNWIASSGGSWKIMLLAGTTDGDFNRAHTTFADIVAKEVATGTGYVGGFAGSGRQVLASRAITKSGLYCTLQAATVIFGNCNGFTPTASVIGWQPTAAVTNADIKLVFWHSDAQVGNPFGVACDGTNLQIAWDPLGVWYYLYP